MGLGGAEVAVGTAAWMDGRGRLPGGVVAWEGDVGGVDIGKAARCDPNVGRTSPNVAGRYANVAVVSIFVVDLAVVVGGAVVGPVGPVAVRVVIVRT